MVFFLLGAGAPVGFQYSAEVTRPAPESTSQGLLLLLGQVSGIVFIVGMNEIGMGVAMRIFIGLAAVNIMLSLFLNESEMIMDGLWAGISVAFFSISLYDTSNIISALEDFAAFEIRLDQRKTEPDGKQ